MVALDYARHDSTRVCEILALTLVSNHSNASTYVQAEM
jgi:hypothetical protein